ncbi:oplophorus-luciferin 2-monooxygenase non-catalytic subunit-like [Eriocheir sinensis]|uniref:oplophorus-luciferin 2-monooxygenase non-catalytic subunit-like n=1 Tax=Eriocheir sinensis TaxID=95602 RepID=UPI0021C980E7|nr:oplophorus-luciferin 2-monooxygenase non-catalytic subunit-like [Eriocheir sinensis]
MSLLRSLLSLMVVVCAAPLCAAEWPCPLDSAIYPCTCATTARYEINVDCSNVQSSDQLARVFQTPFAFHDLNRLTIEPVVPYESLLDLPAGVFGDVSFNEIDITNTVIHTVEEETLVNSHNTLVRLNMEENKISWFPFETLKLYVQLTELDLSYNNFSGVMPDIEMEALISSTYPATRASHSPRRSS